MAHNLDIKWVSYVNLEFLSSFKKFEIKRIRDDYFSSRVSFFESDVERRRREGLTSLFLSHRRSPWVFQRRS